MSKDIYRKIRDHVNNAIVAVEMGQIDLCRSNYKKFDDLMSKLEKGAKRGIQQSEK